MTYLVWKRGLRGPVASIDAEDPRNMPDAKAREHLIVAIIPVAEQERSYTLGTLMTLHPCPPYEIG